MINLQALQEAYALAIVTWKRSVCQLLDQYQPEWSVREAATRHAALTSYAWQASQVPCTM